MLCLGYKYGLREKREEGCEYQASGEMYGRATAGRKGINGELLKHSRRRFFDEREWLRSTSYLPSTLVIPTLTILRRLRRMLCNYILQQGVMRMGQAKVCVPVPNDRCVLY